MICIAGIIGEIIVGQIVSGIVGVLINKTKQIPIIAIEELPELITCRELIGNRTTNRRVPCPEGIEFEGRRKRFWARVKAAAAGGAPIQIDGGPFGRTVIVGFQRRRNQTAAFGIPLRTDESWNALVRIWELFKGSRRTFEPDDLRLLDERARRDIAFAVSTIGRGRNIGIRDVKLIAQIAEMFATGGESPPQLEAAAAAPAAPVADLTDQSLIDALEPPTPVREEGDAMALGFFSGLASFGTSVATALAPAIATTAVQLGVQALSRTGAFAPTPARPTAAAAPVSTGQAATFERRALEATFSRGGPQIPVAPVFSGAAQCSCPPGAQPLVSQRVGGMIAFAPLINTRPSIPLGCR